MLRCKNIIKLYFLIEKVNVKECIYSQGDDNFFY